MSWSRTPLSERALRIAPQPLLAALVSIAALPGCPAKDGASGATGATGEHTAVVGLHALGNDPEIARMAARVAAECTWDNVFATCPPYETWMKDAPRFAGGKADPTLVSLMEDPDEMIRFLGAYKLTHQGVAYRGSAALATRVVAAAEREKSKRFVGSLGEAVARIDVERTGLFERVKAIVLSHAVPKLRTSVLAALLEHNQASARVYDLTASELESPDRDTRGAALSGIQSAGSARRAEVCKLLAGRMADADDALAANATHLVLGWGVDACRGKFDDAIENVEQAVKSGKAARKSDYADALRDLCLAGKPTAAQRTKAAGLARGVAGATSDFLVRIAALDAVAKCDPAGAAAFLAPFSNDSSAPVRRRVKEMLEDLSGARAGK